VQVPQAADTSDDEHSQILTIMKPDIVFFGEGLPDVFHHTLEQDKLSVSNIIMLLIACTMYNCTYTMCLSPMIIFVKI